MSSPVRHLFRGSKCFWHTRNAVDVCIVEHTAFQITEVVIYDPVMDTIVRVYLSNDALSALLSQNEVAKNLALAQEVIIRRHEAVDLIQLRSDAVDRTKLSYLFDRMQMMDIGAPAKRSNTDVQFILRDIGQSCFGGASSGTAGSLICSKPPDLVPFHIDYLHKTIP